MENLENRGLNSLQPMHMIITPIIAHTITAPLDYLRFKLQLDDDLKHRESLTCAWTIYHNSGWGPFFTGVPYICFRPLVLVWLDMYIGMGMTLTIGSQPGIVRKILSELVIYPFELIYMRYLKSRFKDDEDGIKAIRFRDIVEQQRELQEHSQIKTNIQGMYHVINNKRKWRIYDGFLFTVLYVFSYAAARRISKPYVSDALQKFGLSDEHTLRLSSLIAGTLSYPLDTFRRRFMAEGRTMSMEEITITKDNIMKNNGYWGFFKGILMKALKGGVVMITLELCESVNEYRIARNRKKNTIIIYA